MKILFKSLPEVQTDNGQQYMVVVDYYSRYIELVYLANTITHTVTSKLKYIFARFGIPNLLVSDNGPQFSSNGENGQSERAVQLALLAYRSTPQV